jgi:hypothetical protein
VTNHCDSTLHRHPTTAREFAETVNWDLKGPAFSIARATVTLADNTRNGLGVSDQSEVVKFSPGTITIQNNAVAGLAGDIRSVVNLSGGATITNNGPGGAGPDLDLHFGTAAAIAGDNTLGSIVCDATVLLRGSDITCPTP